MKFTAVDLGTRLILYSGTAAVPSLLPHPAFEGFAADPATYRVKVDLSDVEPKPPLNATVDPLTIASGDSVSVTVPEPVSVRIDGESVGEINTSDLITFPDPGSYTLTLEPLSKLTLPQTETITVT